MTEIATPEAQLMEGSAAVSAPTEEPAAEEVPARHRLAGGWIALQSLLGAVVVAMFIMTFLEQPFRASAQRCRARWKLCRSTIVRKRL